MHIILLSGGSGKRLWPLSNGIRSKQFLQLLQSPAGEKESMVQRVVRQIYETVPSPSVTIATGEAQLDIIETQLGTKVDVVAEPERRDTFPAIALSAAYIAMEKGVATDEVVVVMPCDTYTEKCYFETICKMASCVEQRVADLVLMGITPTYPSTKYGYVVPVPGESGGEYRIVQRFTEKPDEENAKALLEQGTFWNGGVFAFRLGYIMDMVKGYIKADDFAGLRSQYSGFPKISFDYEVAEKAASVAVVPYGGKWKDLGTWNTLAEELPVPVMGNVVIDDCSRNTTVINELGLPIVCVGIENAVVAAGYDGIIICGNEASETIKPYVDKVDSRPMYEERRWGEYRVLDDTIFADGSHSLTKSMTLKPGKSISYQKHYHRSEVWTFVSGEGYFVLNGELRRVKAGDTVIIPVGHLHTLMAISELTFIEVQMGNPLIEEDIERFAWDWNNISI